MKTETGNFSNVLLTGTILMANVDVNGLLDYGLKALLGGAIWLGYKLTSDFMDRKRQRKTNSNGHNEQDNSGGNPGGGDAGSDSVL